MEAGQGQGREGNEPATTGGERGGDPSRRGRRRGLLIGGAVALGLLFLTVVAVALVLIVSPGGGTGGGGGSAQSPERFEEKYVSGEGSDKIAVLPIRGAISPDGSQPSPLESQAAATPGVLRDQLRQATEDRRVKGVVLEIDSPGGAVVPTDQMHKAIEDFKEETDKPVIVSMGTTAASGGYFIATAADRIVANQNTLTGSLGVIFSYLNVADAANTYGVEEEVVKSGPYKDIGSSTRKPTDEELKILQSYVDEGYDRFVQVIVEGRGLSDERVREIADGRVYSGQQAESLGLVDELGDLDRAAEIAEDRAGVEKASVVRYQRRSPGLADLLRSRLAPSPPEESEPLKTMKAVGLSPTPELQYRYRP